MTAVVQWKHTIMGEEDVIESYEGEIVAALDRGGKTILIVKCTDGKVRDVPAAEIG